MSPRVAVSSYLTLFTFTRHPRIVKIIVFFSRNASSSTSEREKTVRLAIIGCREVYVSVVLSLSSRTVAVSDYRTLYCPDFPLDKIKRLPFRLYPHYTINHHKTKMLLFYANCRSMANFACRSAAVFCSLATCINAQASNLFSIS